MGVLFILFLGLFGLPPILFVGMTAGVVLGHARAFARRHPWRLALVAALMVAAALPALPFAVVLAGEVLIQWRCDGAACAQGGVGVLLVAQIAWLGGALQFATVKLAFNGRFLPRLSLK
ncbi:MAG TPA: hypothetical protein VJ752_22285 [Burkholderiaceae bacterium]|nr:hypothetical protein [Burkholderiaceae bacterium]